MTTYIPELHTKYNCCPMRSNKDPPTPPEFFPSNLLSGNQCQLFLSYSYTKIADVFFFERNQNNCHHKTQDIIITIQVNTLSIMSGSVGKCPNFEEQQTFKTFKRNFPYCPSKSNQHAFRHIHFFYNKGCVADGVFMSFVVPLEEKEREVLRTVRRYWRRLSRYSSILCIFGQLLLFLPW